MNIHIETVHKRDPVIHRQKHYFEAFCCGHNFSILCRKRAKTAVFALLCHCENICWKKKFWHQTSSFEEGLFFSSATLEPWASASIHWASSCFGSSADRKSTAGASAIARCFPAVFSLTAPFGIFSKNATYYVKSTGDFGGVFFFLQQQKAHTKPLDPLRAFDRGSVVV